MILHIVFYFYNTNKYNPSQLYGCRYSFIKQYLLGVSYIMTKVLLRHKGLIFFISLIIITLFFLIVCLMPKSSKIPSKGVFVWESNFYHHTLIV